MAAQSAAALTSNSLQPGDAPGDALDPQASLAYLRSLAAPHSPLNLQHESMPDLSNMVNSAISGLNKELTSHFSYLYTEHVEAKMDPTTHRRLVRFWKCTEVTAHQHRTWPTHGDQDDTPTYYQWNKLHCLPSWEIRKVWRSEAGWLLVARPEENALLHHDVPADPHRDVLLDTMNTESSNEDERTALKQSLARQLMEAVVRRDRSRSPRSSRAGFSVAAPLASTSSQGDHPAHPSGDSSQRPILPGSADALAAADVALDDVATLDQP